jgi:hypothetical protein
MKRHIGTTAGLLTLIAAVTVTAGPRPAQAETGWARCPRGSFCAFTGLDGTGAMATYTRGDFNLGDATGPSGMNNNIESVWNRMDRAGFGAFNLYGRVSCEGARLHVADEPDQSGRRNLPRDWRNRASSLLVFTDVQGC